MAGSRPGHDDFSSSPKLIIRGLDPRILFLPFHVMASGFCYIMTNRRHGILYVGVTTDISRRAYEHRMGLIEGFTSRYGLIRLVHCEEYPLFMNAVQREKNIKHWPRQWKIDLIEKDNPEWKDLLETML